MDIKDYLHPNDAKQAETNKSNAKNRLGGSVIFHNKKKKLPRIDQCDIAIIGVPDAIREKNTYLSADSVRENLYSLYNLPYSTKIVDLGNIKEGKSPDDFSFALRDVVVELLENNVVPIIIGGVQDYIYSVYQAYEQIEKVVNLTSVNSRFELGNPDDGIELPFLSKMIVQKSAYLFNYANIGFQSYLVDPETVNLLKRMFFDTSRLGSLRNNIKEVEPILRDTDLLNFNINAIRLSDAPGQLDGSPNGMYSEDACQVAKYAGVSDKVSSFTVFGYFPGNDSNKITSGLIAQIIWHFIEGFYQRKKDYPFAKLSEYKKFTVQISELNQDIVFYKSTRTDRWWLEVQMENNNKKRNIIVACSYDDYQKACKQEIPDKWWKTYQKIS